MLMERFFKKRNCSGSILVTVMVGALICSAIAYALLYYTVILTRQSEVIRGRAQARYAAEAALIWANQQLWLDPNWSAPAGVNVPLTIPGVSSMQVTLPICAAPPCVRQLTVTAQN